MAFLAAFFFVAAFFTVFFVSVGAASPGFTLAAFLRDFLGDGPFSHFQDWDLSDPKVKFSGPQPSASRAKSGWESLRDFFSFMSLV